MATKFQASNITINKTGETNPIYTSDYSIALDSLSGNGGGTSDYSDLENKPSINGITLDGDKTLADLDKLK